MSRFAPILGLLILALLGCGDQMSRGIVITGDGKVGSNHARNQRESAQDTLRIAIEDELGKGWSVRVAISEEPVWVADRTGHPGGWGEDGTWRWERLTAAVELVPPPGQQLSEAKRADIEEGSRKYLLGKLVRKDAALLALAVTAGAATPAVVQAPAPVGAGGARSYVVQPGDTLADISTAFYGSPQHWRLIAEANPGGTAAGASIVIPALPAAPAPAPAP